MIGFSAGKAREGVGICISEAIKDCRLLVCCKAKEIKETHVRAAACWRKLLFKMKILD